MMGLTSLEVCNSIFNITLIKNKLEQYKISDLMNGKDLFETVRNNVKEKLRASVISQDLLNDETIGAIIIKEHRITYQENNRADRLINLLQRYKISIFRDFESIPRTEVDLFEDDFRLVLDENNSRFITYDLSPEIYTSNDDSDVLLGILQHEFVGDDNAIDIEFDYIP